jgi:hypothetical protein
MRVGIAEVSRNYFAGWCGDCEPVRFRLDGARGGEVDVADVAGGGGCLFVSSFCIRSLCGHSINTGILPPPGRSQLMRPPPACLHKSTKKISYIVAGLRHRALTLGPSLSSPVPALPVHSCPPSSSLNSSQPSLCAFSSYSSSSYSSPVRSALLQPRLPANRRAFLPLIPTSVGARNSKIAAGSRSSPNNCAMEVFRAVRFPPVAAGEAGVVVALWRWLWRCGSGMECGYGVVG